MACFCVDFSSSPQTHSSKNPKIEVSKVASSHQPTNQHVKLIQCLSFLCWKIVKSIIFLFFVCHEYNLLPQSFCHLRFSIMKVKSNFYWWWDTAILRLCVVETYKSQTRFLNSIENRLMLFCLKFELYCISTLHGPTFNNCLKIITFYIFLHFIDNWNVYFWLQYGSSLQ